MAEREVDPLDPYRKQREALEAFQREFEATWPVPHIKLLVDALLGALARVLDRRSTSGP